mmetsp:Transcript_26860/g.67640  ORF Transcript_26860/g.67640 Transcript_26860/m.67640 type:complete len:294 (-) Transcript_26860:70-951(-)
MATSSSTSRPVAFYFHAALSHRSLEIVLGHRVGAPVFAGEVSLVWWRQQHARELFFLKFFPQLVHRLPPVVQGGDDVQVVPVFRVRLFWREGGEEPFRLFGPVGEPDRWYTVQLVDVCVHVVLSPELFRQALKRLKLVVPRCILRRQRTLLAAHERAIRGARDRTFLAHRTTCSCTRLRVLAEGRLDRRRGVRTAQRGFGQFQLRLVVEGSFTSTQLLHTLDIISMLLGGHDACAGTGNQSLHDVYGVLVLVAAILVSWRPSTVRLGGKLVVVVREKIRGAREDTLFFSLLPL